VLVIGISVLYLIFKYFGSYLGYISILTGISFIAYNFYKKNLTKQTLIYGSIIFAVGIFSFMLNSFFNYSHCECYDILMAKYNINEDYDYDAADECYDKWDDEVMDYESDNKGVYVDPIGYFHERCDR
jgi:hypothetical protein